MGLMKKLFVILVLGLLWCNNSLAIEKCKGDDYKKWDGCYGYIEYVGWDGSTKLQDYGAWKNGLNDGKTITTYSEGTFLSIYKNGEVNGKFISINYRETSFDDGGLISKYLYENGQEVERFSLVNCKRSGQGNFPGSWTNCFGKTMLKDGSFYNGEFKDGTPHGLGMIRYSSDARMPNSIYVGEIKNSKWDGFGVLVLQNNEMIIGEFKNFLLNGIGIMQFNDGKIVRGIWKDSELQE